jgi:putative transposase
MLSITKQAPLPELLPGHGMSVARVFKWAGEYGIMDASMITRLKKMYADERLKLEIFHEVMEKER